jgi:hypothetical protein
VRYLAPRPRRVQDDYGAAFLGSAFPSLVDLPAKKPAGLLAPPDCVLSHVNSLGRDVVGPPRGAFRRVLSGVGAMKAAFQRSPAPLLRIPARDCSAGFNEQLIRGLGRRAAI